LGFGFTRGSGFRVHTRGPLGCRVWGSRLQSCWCKDSGLRIKRIKVYGETIRVHDLDFLVWNFWFRVYGLGFTILSLGFRTQGLGFRVNGLQLGTKDLGFRV
jgi:hypothetical protein